jgi:hypothetical protein
MEEQRLPARQEAAGSGWDRRWIKLECKSVAIPEVEWRLGARGLMADRYMRKLYRKKKIFPLIENKYR